MSIRYSKCHFAEVIDDWVQAKTLPTNRDYFTTCSFCGEKCELVPQEHTIGHDLELTLRRWKEGDCRLEDMFDRVNGELIRSYEEARSAAADTLQGDDKPKYTFHPQFGKWLKEDGEL